MPVLIYNFLQSVGLLADAMNSFNQHCARGIRPRIDVIQENLNRSLMLVTALSPAIGYDKAAQVAKTAHQENITLKEAVLALGFLTEEEFDALMDLRSMTAPAPDRRPE